MKVMTAQSLVLQSTNNLEGQQKHKNTLARGDRYLGIFDL